MNLWINLAASLSLVLLYSGTIKSLEYLELKPRIREQLRAVGDSFFITCLSVKQENVDLYNIKWKFPSGATVISTGRVHIEKTSDGIELVFSKVSEDDGGEYTCMAETSEGKQVENTFRLEVYKKISFDDAPAEQIAEEDKDFVLRCSVSGLPKPKINWKAGGDVLKTGGKYEYLEDGLLIRKVTKEDAKKYECKALQISNTTSAFDLRFITMKVSYAPQWKGEHFHREYPSWIGGTVILTCSAEGIPTPDITWLKNNIIIDNSSTMAINIHEGHSTLKVEVVNGEIYGNYKCQAKNTIGEIERDYTIKEAEKADPPEFTAESHSKHTVHLDIRPPQKTGGLEIKGYRVLYITGGQKWDSSAKMIEFNRNETNFVLQALSPGTTYKIKVAARTEIGYGKISNEYVIVTKVGGITQNAQSGRTSDAPLILNLNILSFLLAIISSIIMR